MKRTLSSFCLIASLFISTSDAASLMSKKNKTELPSIMLSSGMPLADEPLKLQSGGLYQMDIVSDGSAELAIGGADFFRAIWINEIVINKIEVRPLGLDSIEFDDEGTAEIEFIAIKPGQYELYVPGSRGDLQRLAVTIE